MSYVWLRVIAAQDQRAADEVAVALEHAMPNRLPAMYPIPLTLQAWHLPGKGGAASSSSSWQRVILGGPFVCNGAWDSIGSGSAL